MRRASSSPVNRRTTSHLGAAAPDRVGSADDVWAIGDGTDTGDVVASRAQALVEAVVEVRAAARVIRGRVLGVEGLRRARGVAEAGRRAAKNAVHGARRALRDASDVFVVSAICLVEPEVPVGG